MNSIKSSFDYLQLSSYRAFFKPRCRDWHKGLSGHVLIIGGAPGFMGAPRMSAEAALRIGAGLVTVATHPNHAALLSLTCPEIMSHGVKDETELQPLFEKANVIVIGPGLGVSLWGEALFLAASQQALPMIVDADGLNLLAKTTMTNDNWVLTPHPGEAARLLQVTIQQIQQDRLHALHAIQHRYGGVCVLKGAGSLIFAPNSLPVICDKGNPGMASAGMGDVLTGVIAGLIAQGLLLGDAAKLGVYLHAMAGDLAAKKGERGMIATDLMPFIRHLANYSMETEKNE